MTTSFLHGVEVVEIDSGPRPIETVKSAVIGIVGTAPNADPLAFPLNTPALIAGSHKEAALLDTVGDICMKTCLAAKSCSKHVLTA